MLNTGKASRKQVQQWVLNRYYYQSRIPMKDAAILSKCPELIVRREWVKRIHDHDGSGLDAWLTLADAVGLDKDEVASCENVLPGFRFAVDAYVQYAKDADWKDGVCSSLTELYAPEIHKQRLKNWTVFYPWIEESGYEYFQKRLKEANRDVNWTLEFLEDQCTTVEDVDRIADIVKFKQDVLWSMMDSLWINHVSNISNK